MKKTYKILKKCRLCRGKIKKQIILPDTPIGNNLKINVKDSLKIKEYPLTVNKCNTCNHFQLSISIDPNILYKKNYTYLSGIGKNFVDHFRIYSNWIEKKIKLKKNDFILDVGSNDGTCLSFFKKKNFNVCGVDPAKLPSQISRKNNIDCINSFFDIKTATKIVNKYGKPKLITSHNVLAHIEDINKTFRLIYKILQHEGYLCFEVGYFVKVLKMNNFDTIYHEHLDYHTAGPLIQFLNKIGFSVIQLSVNSIQGGSLRVLAKKEDHIQNSLNVKKFIIKEHSLLNNNILVNRFKVKLKKNISDIKVFLTQKNINNKTIIGYGAPTKAALFSKIFNFNSNILKYTIEDNILKIGKYIPGTDIKIIKYKRALLHEFNYIFLFAWNFEKVIIEKIKKDIGTNSNITIIVPNPKLHLIKIC